MSEDQPQLTLLDRLVELLANAMNAVGLNGTRLQWKWRQRRHQLGEQGLRTEMTWRSAKGKHKMCRSCRALVDRSARTCPECGASLAGIQAPGMGRAISNAMPGLSSATSLIMLVNGALFVLMMMWPGGEQESGFGRLMRFDGYTTFRFGAANQFAVLQAGEWYRVVAANFLHGGLIHFGFNTYVLLQLGPLVERLFGTHRFWVFYLVTGISGMAAATVFRPNPVVGASASICGLVGLLLAYSMRDKTGAAEHLKRAMLQFSFMILIISFFPGISLEAHAGGFATGFVIGWVGLFTGRQDERAAKAWQLASLAGIAIVLYSFYQVALRGEELLRYFG
jgi:rhomboid protease GluP